MQIFLFVALFISVLAVVFAVQNNAPVTVTFAAWKYSGSQALVLLVTLLVGALISFFFSLPSNIRTRWTLRQQRKKMVDMETKIADLNSKLEIARKEEVKILPPPVPPAVPPAVAPAVEPVAAVDPAAAVPEAFIEETSPPDNPNTSF